MSLIYAWGIEWVEGEIGSRCGRNKWRERMLEKRRNSRAKRASENQNRNLGEEDLSNRRKGKVIMLSIVR